MKLLFAAALMVPGLIGPAQAMHAPYQQADPFLFDLGPNPQPMRIEGGGLILERVSPLSLAATEDIGYVERTTMRRQGDVVDTWVLIVLPEPTPLGDGVTVDAVWVSLRVDCAARTSQYRASGGLTPNGRLSGTGNNGDPAQPLVKGTNASDVAAIVCGENPNTGMPRFASAREAVTGTRAKR